LVLRGTIVTMDDRHTVIENGSVLVRNDRIVALWQGANPPFGTPVGNAEIVDFGPTALIFPGMINLHDHPTFDMLRLWPAPSSDAEPTLGRPLGTEPYADRYQWNDMLGFSPPEFRRLVENPQLALVSSPTRLSRCKPLPMPYMFVLHKTTERIPRRAASRTS